MERHLRDHMSVSCPAEDFKDRSGNLLEHRHMPVLNEGKQTSRSWIYLHRYISRQMDTSTFLNWEITV